MPVGRVKDLCNLLSVSRFHCEMSALIYKYEILVITNKNTQTRLKIKFYTIRLVVVGLSVVHLNTLQLFLDKFCIEVAGSECPPTR